MQNAVTLKKNNGTLSTFDRRFIDTMERGAKSMIFSNPKFEKELKEFVSNTLKYAGICAWGQLDCLSAMNLNIAVQAKLGELNPKSTQDIKRTDQAVGALISALNK
jgi:hypothetical protein